MRRLILAPLTTLSLATAHVAAQGTRLTPNNGPGTLPMGTVRGERYGRLVIRNATIISGRGTPGTNRGMPPEGPVDIVIENGRIKGVVTDRGTVMADYVVVCAGLWGRLIAEQVGDHGFVLARIVIGAAGVVARQKPADEKREDRHSR